MNDEWIRMKRSIGLANSISTTANAPVIQQTLKRAIEDTVSRCRVQRKRARALETPKDLSDEAVCRAAKWTDRLPLSDYDNVLHLCPRLVNIVTVRCANSNQACAIHKPESAIVRAGSWQRPSPWRGRGSSCRSTCIKLARVAQMHTTRPDALPPSNWPLTPRAAAFWFSTLADSSVPVRFLLLPKRRSCPHCPTDYITGCAGPMAARLSIMRAARQLAMEADVHIHVRNFQVINQVCLLDLNTNMLTSSPQRL